MGILLSIVIIILAVSSSILLTRVKRNEKLILKIGGISLFAIALSIALLNKAFMNGTNAFVNQYFDETTNKFVVILLIMQTFVVLTTMLNAHFENKILNRINRFVSSVFLLILIFSFELLVKAYTVDFTFSLESVLLFLELFLATTFIIYSWLKNYKDYKFNKREVRDFILAIVGILFLSLYNSVLFNVIGADSIITQKDFSFTHRLMLYFILLLIILPYIFAKNKDFETKRMICLFIALSGCLRYFEGYHISEFIGSMTNWPIHLCNTAMIIMPVCIVFKMKRVFYFTYFINVLGALLACLFPNTGDSYLGSASSFHFWFNHIIACGLPILLVALNVFERPKFKQYKYSLIGFFIYFNIILIIDVYLLNFNQGVDYFFMNGTFIVDKLDFIRGLYEIQVSFNIGDLVFNFRPIYQYGSYIVFSLTTAVQWFIYEGLFDVAKSLNKTTSRLRKEKITLTNLKKQLSDRHIDDPVDLEHVNSIYIKDFTFKYDESSDKLALDSVDVLLNSGEIVGFLGENGAGKSTLIKSLVGVLPIEDQKIFVFGYDMASQALSAKKLIGYVPDNYQLYENLTGRQYINFINSIYRLDKRMIEEQTLKYADLLSIVDRLDLLISSYSHGMKQKISLIAALVHEPKILVLDEPLTGLDPYSIIHVKKAIQEFASRGNIVLFSSHLIDLVEKLATDILLISQGKIIFYKDLKELTKEKGSLENIYVNTNKENI